MPTRITILDESTLDQSSISGSGCFDSHRLNLQGRTTNNGAANQYPGSPFTRPGHKVKGFDDVNQAASSINTNQHTGAHAPLEVSHSISVAKNEENNGLLHARSTLGAGDATAATVKVAEGTSPTTRGLTPMERKKFFTGIDITSSKGLSGYGMNCVCSLIVFTTAILYRYNTKSASLLEGHFVPLGRIRAVIILAALGFASSGFIVLCHFDTWIFPKTWASFFQNGSVKERALLIALLIYWIFTLGVSTGLYSPGQYLPNVFLGCWGCLASIFYAYDKWRDEANKTPCISWALDRAYETKLSLVGVALFSTIVLLGVIDFSLNVYVVHKGKAYNEFYKSLMTKRMLTWTITCPAVTLLLSVTILILRDEHLNILGSSRSKSNKGENEGNNNSNPSSGSGNNGSSSPPWWWNAIEGIVHLGFFSTWTFVAFNFTNPLNSVDIMYFGIWLGFLFAMNGFGSWFTDFAFVDLCKCTCKKREEEASET